MEKKSILIKGKIYEMTFEECYKKYFNFRKAMVYKYRYINIETEDLEQEIDISFYMSYKFYDIKTKYEFMTLVYSMLYKYLFRINRDIKRDKRKANMCTLSLNNNVSDDNKIEFIDTLKKEEDYSTIIDIKNIIEGLDERKKRVVNLIIKGYTQNEIAKEIGCSQITVSRERRKILNSIKRVC